MHIANRYKSRGWQGFDHWLRIEGTSHCRGNTAGTPSTRADISTISTISTSSASSTSTTIIPPAINGCDASSSAAIRMVCDSSVVCDRVDIAKAGRGDDRANGSSQNERGRSMHIARGFVDVCDDEEDGTSNVMAIALASGTLATNAAAVQLGVPLRANASPMLSLRRGEAIQIASIESVRLSESGCLEYLLQLERGRQGWLSASDLRTQRSRMDTAHATQVDAWQRDIDRSAALTQPAVATNTPAAMDTPAAPETPMAVMSSKVSDATPLVMSTLKDCAGTQRIVQSEADAADTDVMVVQSKADAVDTTNMVVQRNPNAVDTTGVHTAEHHADEHVAAKSEASADLHNTEQSDGVHAFNHSQSDVVPAGARGCQQTPSTGLSRVVMQVSSSESEAEDEDDNEAKEDEGNEGRVGADANANQTKVSATRTQTSTGTGTGMRDTKQRWTEDHESTDAVSVTTARLTRSRNGESFLPFSTALEYARNLKLSDKKDWYAWCWSGGRPANVPSAPHKVYADVGWQGFGHWLGPVRKPLRDVPETAGGEENSTSLSANQEFLPFEKAIIYARSLNLQSMIGWGDWCGSGARPANIPPCPEEAYAHAGWQGYAHWLVAGPVTRSNNSWLPFEKALVFARALKLKNKEAWFQWCKGGSRPSNIPPTPDVTYKRTGWQGYRHWLGTRATNQRQRSHSFLGFAKALALVRALQLKTTREYAAWCATDARHSGVPARPEDVYAHEGWRGYRHWLGTDNANDGQHHSGANHRSRTPAVLPAVTHRSLPGHAPGKRFKGHPCVFLYVCV